MSDNITLPREVVKLALDDIEWYIENERGGRFAEVREAAEALRTALAAPHPEPVAYFDLQKQVFYWAKPTMIDVPMTVALNPLPLYAAPPAAAPEPKKERAETDTSARRVADTEKSASSTPEVYHEKRHPGYVIGNHWLETAYERLCAGEAEADVLKDCGWERVTDAEALRRDAERYRWLRGEHSRIDPCIKAVCKHPLQRQGHTWAEIHDLDAIFDAAMGDKT
jgi:hypothetical protein